MLCHTTAGRVRGVRNSLAGAKVSVEGGGEVLQVPEQKSPAACGEDHGEAGVEETTVEQVALHQWSLPPVEDPCRSRFRAGPVARGEEPTQEQVTWQELLTVGEPGWSSFLLRDGPRGMDPYLEQFWKSFCLLEAHTGSVH